MVSRVALHSPPLQGASFNYSNRLQEIHTKLRGFEKRIGLPFSVDVSIVRSEEPPSTFPHRRIIQIPTWFLFKLEDIPHHFRISDSNDPRLDNPEFLNHFAFWMNERLKEQGQAPLCHQTVNLNLRKFLRLLENPDLCEKAKEFSLGHELAHVLHAYKTEEQLDQKCETVFSMVGGYSIICVSLLYLASGVNIIVIYGLVGGGVTLIIRGLVILVPFVIEEIQHCPVEDEKKADLDAAEMLRTAEGGIYSFKMSLRTNIALCRAFPSLRKNYDTLGNYLEDKDHPPLSERVNYLTHWQAGRSRLRFR